MKRQLVLLWILVGGVSSAFAAEAAPKGRYLVATRRPAAQARIRFERETPIHRFESVNAFAAELTEAEVAALRKSPEVRFIEPDVKRYAIGTWRSDQPSASEPSQPALTATAELQQTPYGVTMVGAPRIWHLGRGKTIRVGVIDTGLERDHPDLVDDYKGGYDFINNDDNPDDESGHGTHVAGTIAALDNAFGVVGVAPDVEIYSLKVLGGVDGSGSVSDVVRALDWAIEHKLHVVNMSLGSDRPSLIEEEALQRAVDAGIIAVAAAGNGYRGVEGLTYPASYSTVISVGAVDDKQGIATFSQRGSGLKVVGPGVGVFSATPVTVDITAAGTTRSAVLFEGSPRGTITGEFVYCQYGRVGDFPESVRGKIALIQRGPAEAPVTFREKIQNAVTAGAVAAVVFNHVQADISPTLIRNGDGDVVPEAAAYPWPLSVFISKNNGEALQQLPAGSLITVSARSGGYGLLSGTSMATPHVTGVAAAIWSIAPRATAMQVRQAILDSAVDLGAVGFDTTFGFGLVNAHEAARRLAPEKFTSLPRRRVVGH